MRQTRYIVDFTRALFYAGQSAYSQVVLENPWIDLLVMGVMFLVCFIAGTTLFVRHERNQQWVIRISSHFLLIHM